MKRRHIPFVAVWGGLLLTATSIPLSLHNASAKTEKGDLSPAQCVQVTEKEDASRNDSLLITAYNQCTAAVQCSISWVVRCEKGRERKFKETVVIAVNESHEWKLVASMCEGDNWRIMPPTWQCKSVVKAKE